MTVTKRRYALPVMLEVLGRGLIRIRMACEEGNAEKAGAIADALHNLPSVMANGQDPEFIYEDALRRLVARYPELEELRELFESSRI